MRAAGPMPLDFDPPWVREYLPRVLPAGWTPVAWAMDGAKWVRHDRMSVILSGSTEDDGRRWLHVSCARPSRLPSWDDLKTVKLLFLGDELQAVQVLAPRSQWISIHDYCLHLWACLDGLAVPDFGRHGTI